MLFNCSTEAAYALGGPITRAFLDTAELRGKQAVIDTRTHMLKPRWWPAIPGWHHDDVPRTREDGQPNYEQPDYRAQHVMALVGAHLSPTQFALGDCEMPRVPLGEIVYKVWHPRVEELIKRGELRLFEAPDSQLIYFDAEAFHQAQGAKASGWRWFGRASWHTHRQPTNEVRQQVQIYMEQPMEGW